MKINKIFFGGLAMLALTSCNDFLDVDASTDTANTDFVFNSQGEVNTALNGVYAKLLTTETFGGRLYSDFMLNSDVDWTTNSNETQTGTKPRLFDNRSDNSAIQRLWNNLYSGVETANEFIYNLKNSSLYKEEMTTEAVTSEDGVVEQIKEVPAVTDITQMMGEAKVMRAMFYHELLSYFGDIPFYMQSTYETDDLVPPVTDRTAVSTALIDDLKAAAEYMYSDTKLGDAPERISQEAAYAMIARLALQAGGYSLNHDAGNTTEYKMTRPGNYKEFYQTARDYAKKVIDAGGHSLTKSYRDVFVDECNFIASAGDDPIFEIPFAKESTGNWGYAQGPTSSVDAANETNYSTAIWGNCSGGVRTTALYRYTFDDSDLRRDYVCGLWYYSAQGLPTQRFDYAMHNNKWSKMWNTIGLGKSTTGSTGINYAYIRYADVLLMFAEADNEVNNGPTEEARDAVKAVRKRAFEPADYADKVNDYVDRATSKEDFLTLVLDERKWEFAGENMRWKDLVRNNLYSEKLFYTFLTYLSVAQNQGGSAPYMDMCEEYEDVPYSQLVPANVYYTYVRNYNNPNFPNKSVYMLYIVGDGYEGAQKPQASPQNYFTDNALPLTAVSENSITGTGSSEVQWGESDVAWWDGGQGKEKDPILYSLLGYIRMDTRGDMFIVSNGVSNRLSNITPASVSSLPAVRYLLPYPDEAIARSAGVYKNYYGY